MARRGRETLAAGEAAMRLQLSREKVIRLVQQGQLLGTRDPSKGWLVDRGAVERYRRQTRRP
jgi:excisionase family DNA binding protein